MNIWRNIVVKFVTRWHLLSVNMTTCIDMSISEKGCQNKGQYVELSPKGKQVL